MGEGVGLLEGEGVGRAGLLVGIDPQSDCHKLICVKAPGPWKTKTSWIISFMSGSEAKENS